SILALIDLQRGYKFPESISVTLPELTRYSRLANGRYELFVESKEERRNPYTIRVGLSVPDGLHMEEPVQTVTLPGPAGRFPLSWDCVPQRRGQYTIEGAYLECQSPWGLWNLRRHTGNTGEIRVYPNLVPERNRLASIFLNRTGFGIHAQRQIGKGREFEQLREYIPGDSYEDIHWKATARRGFPITKIYQIERTQEVYVIVDASRLSARSIPGSGPGGEPEAQLEHSLSAALLLGVVAEKQGDFFGLVTFSNRVHSFIRAGKGRGHFNSCREALYTLEPQRVNPDFEELCTFIRLRLRRRALLIFLTNLDDPVLAESFSKNLELLSNRHLVMVNMITPAHVKPIFSQGQVKNLDEIYHHLGGHLQWQTLRETQRNLQRHGVKMHLASHESLCADMVSQYVNVKQRQAL
ncbi:MAG: DUF58 domain-containing protein, partial [Candidatus Hydrogenedentes bacterium]|nr:DUF58 domain-containing protein [Candidatus Hydrogenedentota bacterium]